MCRVSCVSPPDCLSEHVRIRTQEMNIEKLKKGGGETLYKYREPSLALTLSAVTFSISSLRVRRLTSTSSTLATLSLAALVEWTAVVCLTALALACAAEPVKVKQPPKRANESTHNAIVTPFDLCIMVMVVVHRPTRIKAISCLNWWGEVRCDFAGRGGRTSHLPSASPLAISGTRAASARVGSVVL